MGAPPLREILDPPLRSVTPCKTFKNSFYSLCIFSGFFCSNGNSKDFPFEDRQPFDNKVEFEEIVQDLESQEFIEDLTLSEISEEQLEDFPFRNVSLPWDERVEDLVSRLTIEEITLQVEI